jgi:SAM-dependent methyltransferase
MSESNQVITDYFEGLLQKHGPSHLALDWNSAESQIIRFKVLSRLFFMVGKKNLKILDLGCGIGDFYGFLDKTGLMKKYDLKYFGYDISEKMIEAAKKKYPKGNFQVKDLVAQTMPEKFDLIFESGIFNLRLGSDEEHLDYVKRVLLKAWSLAKFGMGFNFLSQNSVYYATQEDLDKNIYFYFKPEQLAEWARALSDRFSLDHNYHVADFTVFLLK